MACRNPAVLYPHDPLVYDEPAVTKAVDKKPPYAENKVIHVQGHKIRASEEHVDVWLQQIQLTTLFNILVPRKAFLFGG